MFFFVWQWFSVYWVLSKHWCAETMRLSSRASVHVQVKVAGVAIKNDISPTIHSALPYPKGKNSLSMWTLHEVNHMKYLPPFFLDSKSQTHEDSCRGAITLGYWKSTAIRLSPSSGVWNFRMQDIAELHAKMLVTVGLLLFLRLFLPPLTRPQDLPLGRSWTIAQITTTSILMSCNP